MTAAGRITATGIVLRIGGKMQGGRSRKAGCRPPHSPPGPWSGSQKSHSRGGRAAVRGPQIGILKTPKVA